ncbi:MAG: ATP-grasp domain-containing protein [Solirubrobacteraceae bacterium]
MRVLIVDEGLERCAVAAARALAARGWTVGAGSAAPNLAARSRATSAWHRIPHTDDGEELFIDSVNEVVGRHGYDAVFVTWEAAVAALSAHRDRLRFPVGYGPHDGVLHAMDKERLMRAAERAGLAVPTTVHATSESLSRLSGAIIVKPASPVDAKFAAASFASPSDALQQARLIEQAGGRPLAQEQLRGSLIAVSLVAGTQGVVSIAQQVAVQVWPRPVGVTARGRTVAVDAGLRARIERLLEELQWQGLAQLQFLVPEDGEPRLLDFNPRYYGSMALAIAAGANHPDVWARLTTGLPVQPASGRPGVTFQWFTRDLRASLASPDRRELARCVLTAATAAHSLWSWEEPWLAPGFLLEQAARAARRRLLEARRRLPEARRRLPAPSAGGDRDAIRSARLHRIEPTPAVCRALRTRRVPTRPERVAQRLRMKAGALSYEDSWLSPLQAARAQALSAASDTGPRFLVRVDEFPYYSGLDDPRYGREASERFHAVMAEERVPHLMSVLPQWTHQPLEPAGSGGRPLDDEDCALFEQMRRDGVTFAQHGHTHRTRYSDPRRRSELCGLDPGQLTELLEGGRRKLAEAGVHPRILVPPFNRFDAAQWPVLERLYDIVTGGPESVLLMGFHGGPQWRGSAVYLPCYEPLYASAATVLPAAQAMIDGQVGGWIPIVLHMGWELDDGFAALRRLAKRVAPYAASWEDLLAAADASRQA